MIHYALLLRYILKTDFLLLKHSPAGHFWLHDTGIGLLLFYFWLSHRKSAFCTMLHFCFLYGPLYFIQELHFYSNVKECAQVFTFDILSILFPGLSSFPCMFTMPHSTMDSSQTHQHVMDLHSLFQVQHV